MAFKQGLVAYWKLDEASGDALDAIGSNNLTETSGTIDSAAGKINTCRDFEAGDTEYFTAATNSTFETGDIDFTFQAWVKLESKPLANMTILGKWGSATTREYTLIWQQSTDRFQFVVTDDGATGFGFVNATGAPVLGTWYLIHCWHDSVNNVVGISINGGTANTSGHLGGVFLTAANFTIGRNDDGAANYFDGTIDEVGFWKKVLTSTERSQLYAGGAGLALEAWDQTPIYELNAGPPLRGSPWLQRLPVEPSLTYMEPGSILAIGGNPSAAPEISSGPALLGAPWARVLVTDGLMQPPDGGATPDVVLPTGPGRGKQRPFFHRAPRPGAADYERRMASLTEKQTNMLNSLIRQGVLAQTSADSWILRTGGFAAPRAPMASDDDTDGIQVGSIFTDTSALQAYVCVSNATQAAVWKLIT